MAVFSAVDFDHHENVVFCHDPETGLKAIIAVHNTTLGPSLGGCRMWNYATEQDAITDVLRLSRGMTFKAALANLPLGGGKAVIMGSSKTDKTPALFQSFGRFVERLNGLYITAEDVGTNVEDMVQIHKSTSHVVGLPTGAGDPSPMTALGVYQSIRASVAYKLEKDSLKGLKIAIQGLGNVGSHLCEHLAEEGAELFITDIDEEKVQRLAAQFKATAVPPQGIHGLDVDVFAPCALGASINPVTLPQLKCSIVTGAANNQLSTPDMADQLKARHILYAPDYIVNAGGLIAVTYEISSYDAEKVRRHIEGIHDTLLTVFRTSDQFNISTENAAHNLACERLKQAPKKNSNGDKKIQNL